MVFEQIDVFELGGRQALVDQDLDEFGVLLLRVAVLEVLTVCAVLVHLALNYRVERTGFVFRIVRSEDIEENGVFESQKAVDVAADRCKVEAVGLLEVGLWSDQGVEESKSPETTFCCSQNSPRFPCFCYDFCVQYPWHTL